MCCSQREKRKNLLFLKKKKQKDFLFRRSRQDSGHGLEHGGGGDIKVFCFFSSEKKTFSL
jgi:hypothetical protein